MFVVKIAEYYLISDQSFLAEHMKLLLALDSLIIMVYTRGETIWIITILHIAF